MQTFELLIVAPIPIGSRVEMTWYRTPSSGLLSGTQLESHPYAPVVRDLSTGIIYGGVDTFWQRGSVTVVPPGAPLSLQWDPLAGSQVEYRVVGKVLACRVATRVPRPGRTADLTMQTTLVVEPDP